MLSQRKKCFKEISNNLTKSLQEYTIISVNSNLIGIHSSKQDLQNTIKPYFEIKVIKHTVNNNNNKLIDSLEQVPVNIGSTSLERRKVTIENDKIHENTAKRSKAIFDLGFVAGLLLA